MSAISVGNEHFANQIVMDSSKRITHHFLHHPLGAQLSTNANHSIPLAFGSNLNGSAGLPVAPNPQFQFLPEFGYHYYALGGNPEHLESAVARSCLQPGDLINNFPRNSQNLESPDRATSHQVQNILLGKMETLARICPSVPVPLMSRSSFNVGYYVPPSVEPGDPYGGLEIVWNQHFGYLFSSYTDDVWEFGPLNPSKDSVTDCTVFRDMAKVRFCCRKCTHGWTSMHGPVMFYYRYEPYMRKGHVRFILTGQKCIECKSNDFETPMWYPEEAQKAMTNLYYEIASKVYGKATPPLIRDRRHGRPRQQHIATDCQGCHLGICKPMIEPKNT